MRSREEAARFAEQLMSGGAPSDRKRAWHFGKVDLRDLFDFIYDGPPASKEEALFEPRPATAALASASGDSAGCACGRGSA